MKTLESALEYIQQLQADVRKMENAFMEQIKVTELVTKQRDELREERELNEHKGDRLRAEVNLWKRNCEFNTNEGYKRVAKLEADLKLAVERLEHFQSLHKEFSDKYAIALSVLVQIANYKIDMPIQYCKEALAKLQKEDEP